jgi:DNA-binding NarL/FixJ family response regulator
MYDNVRCSLYCSLPRTDYGEIDPFLVAVRRPVRRGFPASSQPRRREVLVPYSILIVDDSELIRRFLRFVIEHNTEWQICGEAVNGEAAVEMVEELHPDMVILDFQMPVMNGLEAARRITRIAPKTTMVMFTMHDSPQLRQEAESVGIKDVISKSDGHIEHVIVSLKNVLASALKQAAA